MHAFSRTAAGLGTAALIVLGSSLAAHADPPLYTPTKPDPWSATTQACSTLTRTLSSHSFDAGATLQLSVTGPASAPTLALFTASQFATRIVSDADGGAVIKLNFGPSASGTYNVTLSEPGTDLVSYGTVAISPAASGTPGCSPAATVSATSLPSTGTAIDTGVLWGAAAAVGAGLLLWLSRVPFHRSRRRRTRER